MLQNFFLQVINMSLTASIVILIVLAARIILRKVPKVFSYMLWAIVLFRLLCPVSLSSNVSIFTVIDIPSAKEQTIEPIQKETLEKPLTVSDDFENITEQPNSRKIYPAVNIEQKQSLVEKIEMYLPWIWFVGVVCIVIINLVQLRKLHKKMVGAVCLQDNLYLSDYIREPFVIGLIRPKIYFPSNLEEKEYTYIKLHEQFHIRRLDHITRALAFVALCIHWFNPLVWLAFRLSAKDMEMSCDEAVMNTMKDDIRSEYAQSLLNFAVGHRKMDSITLAFGESDTKSRIKNVMSWKKPAIWGIVAAVICMIVLGAMLMTNPEQQESLKEISEENIEMPESIETVKSEENVEESDELSEEGKKLFYSQWKITGVAGTTTEYEESNFEADSMIEQAVGSVIGGNPDQLYIKLKNNLDAAVIVVDENLKVKERLVTSAQFEEEWGINPENILLFGDEFIEIEVSVEGDFPGGKGYFSDDQKAVFYFESVFFSAELTEMQAIQTEEDYYKIATSLPAVEVEQYAMNIRLDILEKDWASLAGKIAYPISLSGITVNNSTEFLNLDIDGILSQEFVNAISDETCRSMFCNWQGVSMGATGQIWFAEVNNGNGASELKIIGINGIFE